MVPADLIALADRCEREEPSRLLDVAIALVSGYADKIATARGSYKAPIPVTLAEASMDWIMQACEDDSIDPGVAPLFTTSLDAAVTPEGWRVYLVAQSYDGWSTCLHRSFGSPEADEAVWRVGHSWPAEHMVSARGKTEPMARRAAELRALAALLTDASVTKLG